MNSVSSYVIRYNITWYSRRLINRFAVFKNHQKKKSRLKKKTLVRKSPKLTPSEVMKYWLFIYQLLYPYEFLYKFLISKNFNKTNVSTKTGVNSDYGNSWFVVPQGTIPVSIFRSDISYLAVNPWPVYCISNAIPTLILIISCKVWQ